MTAWPVVKGRRKRVGVPIHRAVMERTCIVCMPARLRLMKQAKKERGERILTRWGRLASE